MGTAYRKITMPQAAARVLFTALFATSIFVSNVAYAADTNAMCTGGSFAQLFCQTDMTSMLNTIFQLAIGVGGVLAILRIVWAGWLYMGADFDNVGSKSKAKEVFQNAIIGLLLLLAIWLILNQINPQILDLNLVESLKSMPSGNATPQASYPPSGI
jgi:hypothetical protein